MSPRRNPLLVAMLLLLCVSGLGGAAWFLAAQPVSSWNEQNILCSRCALQRGFGSRRILGFSGQRTTNDFVTEMCAILRGSPPRQCDHFWHSMNDADSTLALRPLPRVETHARIYLDMNGLSDQKPFLEAMRSLAGADLGAAQSLWSNLVWRTSKNDPAVVRLKSIVQQNQPVETVRAFITNLPKHFPVTF